MPTLQKEFTATGAGLSQCDKILARLRQTPGDWVSEPDLLAVSGSHAVHARIGDLRKRGRTAPAGEGFQIENRTARVLRNDGSGGFSIHSDYRITYFDQP